MNSALGVIEFHSIPTGYKVYNRILKDVHIQVYQDLIIAPGRFIIMIEGSYAGVHHALEYALNSSSEGILDYALIGNIDSQLADHLEGKFSSGVPISDLCVIESETVCAGIELANRLLHGISLSLIKINYNVEMHGKCLLVFGGKISSIQSALELAGSGELISNPEEIVFRSITGELENK